MTRRGHSLSCRAITLGVVALEAPALLLMAVALVLMIGVDYARGER